MSYCTIVSAVYFFTHHIAELLSTLILKIFFAQRPYLLVRLHVCSEEVTSRDCSWVGAAGGSPFFHPPEERCRLVEALILRCGHVLTSPVGGHGGKNPPANARDTRHVGLIPVLRPPRIGNGNPLQYTCLENPMDKGVWWATVHGGRKELDTTERLTHTHTHTHTMLYSTSP